MGAGSQQLSSAAYLSGGERDVSKQAREARVNAHWLLYPLRFIHRIGGAKIWVGFIGAYFILRRVGPPVVATAVILTYLVIVVYSWVIPPIVRWWFNYQYGKVR